MKQSLSVAWWAASCEGRLLGGDQERICRTVGTDTRADLAGALFVALRGENYDGHAYLAEAAGQGACALLFEALPEQELAALRRDYPEVGLIEVADTAVAYSQLARAWRLHQDPYVIALTGSVGKTTTRDLIAAALHEQMRVHKTKANLNNIIGVPQSVFAMPEETELAIFELGMHISGEIRRSSLCTAPDLAVITNVGTSHIGNFADGQQGILRAKAEIVDGLQAGGILLLNGDDPLLLDLALELKERFRVVFTHRAAHAHARLYEVAAACGGEGGAGVIYTASEENLEDLHVHYTLLRETVTAAGVTQETLGQVACPAPGEHQVMNTLFAMACAGILELPIEQANRAMQSFTPTGHRQRLEHYGPYTVINDAYNASPESMGSAFALLEALAQEQGGRPIAALGCMAEQGAQAEELHKQVGRDLARYDLTEIHVIGPEAGYIAAGAQEVKPELTLSCYDDMHELTAQVLQNLEAGDTVLVKGSRVYAMERLAASIAEWHEASGEKRG